MNTKKHTLLIVEDQPINAQILSNILKKDFDILLAANGLEALNILHNLNNDISCILLDLVMPVVDGYEFLDQYKDLDYQNIPVIVMTGSENKETEKKILDAGAWDYIRKPYERDIIISRVNNAISRSQTEVLEQLQYVSSHDTLTGLYNRRHMFKMTKYQLERYPDKTFVFLRFDLRGFRRVNSFYGEDFGNAVLKHIADKIKIDAREYEPCVFGRMEADIFCICAPFEQERIEDYILNVKRRYL